MYAKGAKSQLLEKLRQRVFGSKQNTPSSIIQAIATSDSESVDQILHVDVFVQELEPSISLSRRINLVNELCPVVKTYTLSDLNELWNAVQVLLDETLPPEATQAALRLMIAIIHGQYESLGSLRPVFYATLKRDMFKSEFQLRFLALRLLSKDGRDLSYFDSTFSNLIYECLSYCVRAFTQVASLTARSSTAGEKSSELVNFEDAITYFTNLVKFNFVSFEERDLIPFVRLISSLHDRFQIPSICQLSLNFMDVIIRYGYVPFEALQDYIHTLCKTATSMDFQEQCWHIVRNLLSSHSAYKAMYILCKTLEETQSAENIGLLQGAVFFVGMANWSTQKMENLFYSFSYVLPCLHRAILSGHLEVELEILLNVHRIVLRFAKVLSNTEWELLFDILEEVNYRIAECVVKGQHGEKLFDIEKGDSLSAKFQKVHNNVLIEIKNHFLQDTFFCSPQRFIQLLESLNKLVAVPYIHIIIDYYDSSHECYPTCPDWQQKIEKLVDGYFIGYGHREIREKVFGLVKDVYTTTKDFYQSQLLKSPLLTILQRVPEELDGDLAQVMLTFLIDVLFEFPQTEFMNLYSILLKCVETTGYDNSIVAPADNPTVKMEPMKAETSGHIAVSTKPVGSVLNTTNGQYDLREAVIGLFVLSTNHLPQEQCLEIFGQLNEMVLNEKIHVSTRLAILDCFLSIRASPRRRIYFDLRIDPLIPIFNEYTVEFPRLSSNTHLQSVFNVEERIYQSYFQISSETDDSGDGSIKSCKPFPLDMYLETISKVLFTGNCWDCTLHILTYLPAQLYNTTTFSECLGSVNELRNILCSGVISSSLGGDIRNRASKLRRSTLYELAFYVLGAFLCYRSTISKQHSDEIILAFQIGLFKYPNTAKICIQYLTLCCYQLPMSMTKLLPSILAKLSQIMSAGTISVQILEFLSTLARLPDLYVNFVESDYKLVFGIAIQYIQHTAGSQLQSKDSNAGHTFSQYVLEMAYHVLIVWYMSLKVTNRRLYVSFIVRGLVMSQKSDVLNIVERNEVVFDMLARYSYTAVEPKSSRPYISNFLFDKNAFKVTKKSWIQGTSLYTIESNMDLGWAEISIRRPSGSLCFLTKLETRLIPFGSTESALKTILMSHIPQDAISTVSFQERESESSPKSNGEVETFYDSVSELTHSHNIEGPLKAEDLEITKRKVSDQGREMTVDNSNVIKDAIRTSASQQQHSSKAQPQSLTDSSSSKMNEAIDAKKESILSDRSVWQLPLDKNGQEIMFQLAQQSTTSAKSDHLLIESNLRSESHDSYFDPSFFFLQLSSYPDPNFTPNETPFLLPDDSTTQRALSVLDRIFVIDFHKIAVIYVGPNQTDEVEILANKHGSEKYNQFLRGLGQIFSLKNCTDIYTGGLDTENNTDGDFSYFFKDAISQTIFHIPTMMPTICQTDPRCSAKKRHIGNDFVTIVYNDSGLPYSFNTIPGQFNFANLIVEPLGSKEACTESQSDVMASYTTSAFGVGAPTPGGMAAGGFFKVSLQRRPDMPEIGPLSSPKIVPAQALPSFVRQIALHINIFVQIFILQSQSTGSPVEYVSNWRERLRQLKRIRERCRNKPSDPSQASVSGSWHAETRSDSVTSTPTLTEVKFPDTWNPNDSVDFTKFT
jgi:hypothetical protein